MQTTFAKSVGAIHAIQPSFDDLLMVGDISGVATFNHEQLQAFLKEGKENPPAIVIDTVSQHLKVSTQFITTGVASDDDLIGIVDVQKGGNVAYMINLIAEELVDYLCKQKPTMGKELTTWDCWEDRGFDLDSCSSLDEAMEEDDSRYPEHPINFMGVVVGKAITKETADWMEAELIDCAKLNKENAVGDKEGEFKK